MRVVVMALVWALSVAAMARADADPAAADPLMRRLDEEVLAGIFPGATRAEALADGGPPAAAVYAGDDLAGYAFSTLDVLRAPGYSSTPFDVVAGVTLNGRITGAAVLFHREPYLLNDARRTGQLVQFLDALAGREARIGAEGGLTPDYVAGATISARAMRNAVLEGAGIVLRYRNGVRTVTEPTVDLLNFRPMTASELVKAGALSEVTVTNADLREAMERAGLADHPLEIPAAGRDDAIYLDLQIGFAMAPTIGRNGAGQWAFDRLREGYPEGTHAVVVGSNGVYDFRGTKYNNLSHRFLLERIALVQGDTVFEFRKPDLVNATYELGDVAALLVLPPDSGFDPLQPWRAEIYANVRLPEGGLQRFLLTSVEYQLPTEFVLMPPAEAGAAWVEPWVEGRGQIAVLVVALAALTLILAFQDRLTRSRRAHRWIRTGFLLFTLVWTGWIASAQLSIVHLLNYLQAPFLGFGIGYYMAEPLIVLISLYTAVSLILLGRGVFCGWLCPFGALQELLANAARALRLPQWNPSERVQAVLWNGKYVALAVVVVLAIFLPAAGAIAEEVEPFKTAITAMFVRGWPYVLYAVAVLGVGLFTERAFCRYLCPLGGALALLDRLHLLDLLKRRPECGNPCSLCERACPVRAIESSGRIKMAECFQCLDCQVEYHDDRRCPPLAKLRKQRERLGAGERPGAAPIPALSGAVA